MKGISGQHPNTGLHSLITNKIDKNIKDNVLDSRRNSKLLKNSSSVYSAVPLSLNRGSQMLAGAGGSLASVASIASIQSIHSNLYGGTHSPKSPYQE